MQHLYVVCRHVTLPDNTRFISEETLQVNFTVAMISYPNVSRCTVLQTCTMLKSTYKINY